MRQSKVLFAILSCSCLGAGCSSSPTSYEARHHGPKINVADFITNTIAYKNRSITLALKVGEPIDRKQGQSLRDFVGKDVMFTNIGPKGEQLKLTINIPNELSVPDVAYSDEVSVTFLCSLGSLSRGNQAQIIAASSGGDGD